MATPDTPPRPATEPPSLWLPLFAAATLGLAPYAPQPHVVEKLRWLLAGAPFRPIDIFDLVLHGSPWVWLGVAAFQRLRRRPHAN